MTVRHFAGDMLGLMETVTVSPGLTDGAGAVSGVLPGDAGPGTASVWGRTGPGTEITFSQLTRKRRPSVAVMTISEAVQALLDQAQLNAEQVARLLGVSRRTVQAWKVGSRPSAAREQRVREIADVVLAYAFDSGREKTHETLTTGLYSGEPLLDVVGRGMSPAQLWRHLGEVTALVPDGPTLAPRTPRGVSPDRKQRPTNYVSLRSRKVRASGFR